MENSSRDGSRMCEWNGKYGGFFYCFRFDLPAKYLASVLWGMTHFGDGVQSGPCQLTQLGLEDDDLFPKCLLSFLALPVSE